MKGKSISEKSKMMADAWRHLSSEEKKKYSAPDECSSDDTNDKESELTPKDAKELAMRVAKRHQGDVCFDSYYATIWARYLHVILRKGI